MHVFWRCQPAAIGLAMFVGGRTRSEFFLYRLIVAGSKIVWGKHVHAFHQVAGILVAIYGLLIARGVIPMKQDQTRQPPAGEVRQATPAE